jgi:hypothetical protein
MAILCWLSPPAWSQDREAILKAVPLSPGDQVDSVRGDGDWALVGIINRTQNYGQDCLVRRLDGRWRLVRGGRPTFSPRDYFVLGVPAGLWKQFCPRITQEEVQAVLDSGPGWPETRMRQLRDDDLQYRTFWELTLMRNEIFARHGRPFQDAVLRDYFQSRPWYSASPNYNDGLLSPTERSNAAFLLDYQHRTGRW